jgi:hypothetical protein
MFSAAAGRPIRSAVRRLPLLLLLTLAAVPPAHPQDIAPPPGFFGWTLVNECSVPIRVALHYAPDGELVTEGWWSLDPGSELVSHSATQFVAYIAESPEMRVRAPNLGETYELAVDPAGDFIFGGFTPPDEFEPATFYAVELTDWSVTFVECEGKAEPASEGDGGVDLGVRAEPEPQADALPGAGD